MPQVYICSRCAEKIDDEKQDWVLVAIGSTGGSALEARAHAECEVKRLKDIEMKNTRTTVSITRGPRV